MRQVLRQRKALVAILLVTGLAALLLAGCGGGAGAEKAPAGAGGGGAASVADEFKGKVINFIVPYNPGGGYDAYARMVAPYLEKYTGATVVVRNVPGGGSLVGTNQLYVSKPDGLTIGLINGVGAVTNQVFQTEGVQFDLNKFTWLGRMVAEPQVTLASQKSGFQSIEDIQKAGRAIKVGSSGQGSTDHITNIAVAKAFGYQADIITGYDTSAEVDLAMVRGEVELISGSVSSKVQLVKNKDGVPILQVGVKPSPEFPDVPLATDLPTPTPEGKEILNVLTSMLEIGRAVAAPPGLSAEKARFLAEALEKAMQDPDLLKDSQSSDRPVSNVAPAEMQKLVQNALNMPESFKQLLSGAYK